MSKKEGLRTKASFEKVGGVAWWEDPWEWGKGVKWSLPLGARKILGPGEASTLPHKAATRN